MEEKEKVSDESRQKTVWGYAGKVTLWVALALFGLAMERLGLTSGILSGALPGELQRLRATLAQTGEKVQDADGARRQIKLRIGGLEDSSLLADLERCVEEVKRLEAQP